MEFLPEEHPFYYDVTQDYPGIAGGLSISEKFVSGYFAFLAVQQGTIDPILVYEGYMIWCSPEHDVGVRGIKLP